MLFNQWQNHLSSTSHKGVNGNTIWSTTSDFFSLPSFMDMFHLSPTNFSAHSEFTETFNAPFSKELMSTINIDMPPVSYETSSLISDNASSLSFLPAVGDLESTTFSKSSSDVLVDIFPSMDDFIDEVDMWSRYHEESLQFVESTPDVKLYYPEPFIASPSFVHEELWFIHILHYNHWLWFMFISLIMFYFITFINVVRWCNLRNKPKRETRGVSRSKCADLITATVPVSWATSIIISETVDAADYYDGFGTGEIVIGIRAYQWGWEYFYPKGIDLNYNVKPSYSTLVGNSIKYNNSSATNVDANSVWKSYQSKTLNSLSTTPSHLLLSPSDQRGHLNLADFSKIGLSSLSDSSAFKKVQYFSKVNPHNLYSSNFASSPFSSISNNTQQPSALINSSSYSVGRQQGSSSKLTTQYDNRVSLDPKSMNQFLSYNYNVEPNLQTPYFFNNEPLENSSSPNLVLEKINNGAATESSTSIGLDTRRNIMSSLNNSSDGKYFGNPVKYALHGSSSSTRSTDGIDYNNSTISNYSDVNHTNRFKDLKSGNLNFLSSDKNIRLLDKVSHNKPNFNFSSSTGMKDIFSHASNESELFDSSNSSWVNNKSANILANTSFNTVSSHTPIYSNSPHWSDKSFDKFPTGSEDGAPNMLRSKEETAPEHVFGSFWETYWANTSVNHRMTNMILTNLFTNNFYLPHFNEYTEYDFKNWQALELLEDSFWESTYSSFVQDEYLNLLQSNNEFLEFKKQEEMFNTTTRDYKFKNSRAYKPALKSASFSSLPIYSEDSFASTYLIPTDKMYNLPSDSYIDLSEESFESSKSTRRLFNSHYSSLISNDISSLSSQSYSRSLDPFRADYEDTAWNFNNDLTASNGSEELDSLSERVSNTMKIRSTTRNSIVTYNAMQKVFKSRLDEGRSHSRLQDFSNSHITHTFITEPKSAYESLLGKNKESFFSPQLHKSVYNNNFNLTFSIWNSLNSTLLDVPFLISAKSDPSRYLWFDWQSRWSSIEVQPSSIARFSLSGVPYFNKSSEFETQNSDNINESENYFNKLARSRKNYLSNWALSPYFYSRVSNWYKSNSHLGVFNNDLENTYTLLSLTSPYWNNSETTIFNQSSTLFSPSASGVNTPTRSSWRPMNNISSFNYSSSTLVDILTKREFVYRTYFNSKGFAANLPTYMTASPNNPLLEEIKMGYSFIDPTTFSSELSREKYYSDTNFMRLELTSNAIKYLTSVLDVSGVNLSFIQNYMSYYLLGSTSTNKLANNQQLYTSQYRPMKKGITNMIRLHATGAIAMPIEIRMHVLASSRDVIHSWSIPSAGIKIDCVPGYSSHRITIFLVSGIFWGQCMEICGRFHHWMPIVVYFMKRDLFFLWCTHFMHYSTSLDIFDMTDKQLADRLRIASFDKTSWVSELNSIL